MTRPNRHFWLLAPAALAGLAVMASAAWAGDRYGGYEGPGGDYASSDYSERSSMVRGQAEYDGASYCAAQTRQSGYRCAPEAVDAYNGGQWYGRPEHVQSERAQSERAQSERGQSERTRVEDRRDFGEAEQIDPCAAHSRLTGRDCVSADAGYDRDGRGYRGETTWRSEQSYTEDSGPVYDRTGDRDGYVDACAVVHARMGERCPFQDAERRVYQDERPIVWVEERLPDSFFIGEGGVGPGIVDYGGGGGGGAGEFAGAESFSGADAFASASARASASASISIAIAQHNHHMMGQHYPPRMHGGGCGCGGKKGY